MRPTESGTRCSFAFSRSLRFIARTMFSLSSCGPVPTCAPAPAGPHCFGGGALAEVRRPWPGLRLRGLFASASVPSLPMTVAAMPWMADHELPHSPDSGLEAFREPFKACVLGDLVKADSGSDVVWKRDRAATPGFEVGAGEAFLEVNRDPFLLPALSLPSPAYMSSSTEISLRVRGRSVELLLDVDNEGPLAGFMACAQPERVKNVELHRPKAGGRRVLAWHAFTESW
jgi:hypothetical protein